MKDHQTAPLPLKVLIVDDHQIIVKALTLILEAKAYEMLRATDESWKITGMILECGVCRGSGKAQDKKSDCDHCQGQGRAYVGGAPI
jgi:hypothetical protein